MNCLNFESIRDSDGLAREEGELLYGLVRAVKPTLCVETGTHRGLSACYIGQALKDNGIGKLITVDPYYLGANESLEMFGLKDQVTYLQIRGVDIRVMGTIDFLFIDGYHGLSDVVAEIDALFPKLSANALVIFHDCDINAANDTAGVNAAVKARGLRTVFIPTANRMRIYEHSCA